MTAETRGEALRGLATALAVGLLLAFSGAFGTGDAPLAPRTAYWLSVMAIGLVWGHVSSRLLTRWVVLDDRPWLHAALLTAMISGPLTVAVWLVTGPFFGGAFYPMRALPVLFLPVLAVTAVMSLANVFLGRRLVETHAAPPDGGPPRFLDRLPPRLRGARLIAVEAEDHYLRLHTDRGSDLILMRLADALRELEGLEGAQTHRSWWVAKDAVRGVKRGDGRALLTLDGGLEAPVSRRHARALREAGWY